MNERDLFTILGGLKLDSLGRFAGYLGGAFVGIGFCASFLGLADFGAGADSAVGMMASAVKSLSRLMLPIKASKPRFVPSPRFFVMPIYTSVTENSRVFYHK